MRTETEMIAYALEADPRLLPWVPELLRDLDELGGDATLVVEVLEALDLPKSARVVDLGCGKGAVAIAIAHDLGFEVEGIDLFAPFVEICRERAAAAGVSDRCSFRHGDILKAAGRTGPADVAILAALGDVLGSLEDTIGVVRRFVRPGGFMVICDDYLKDGGSADFPGFESYAPHEESLRRLQAHGDALRREVVDSRDHSEAFAYEIARIRKRAEKLAEQHPSLAAEFLRFAKNQQREYDYMAANVGPAVWVLQRGGAATRTGVS